MGLLVDMIDVGQGDSFLLTIDGPQGEVYILIDGGPPEAGYKVWSYVTRYAPTGLSMVVATHIDNDHIGGLATVLTHATLKPGATLVLNVPPAIRTRWTPVRSTLERYKGVVSFKRVIDAVDAVNTLSALANRRGMNTSDGMQGRWWTYGGVVLNVLNPNAGRLAGAWEESELDEYLRGNSKAAAVSRMEAVAEAPDTSAENDSSIVIGVTLDGVPRALMASDAGAAVLKEVTDKSRYPFLKVPHHGSATGMDEELIRQLRPQIAAIPVGDNPHGHPSIETLDLLRRHGAVTYCSSKTRDCRKSCTFNGGPISFPIGRGLRPGWSTIDTSLCKNNPET